MTQPLRITLRLLAGVLACSACGTDPAPGAPDTQDPGARSRSSGAAQRGGSNSDDGEDDLDASSAGDASSPPKSDAGGAAADAAADGSFGAFNDASLGLLDGGTLTPGVNDAGVEAGLGEAGPKDASAEGG